MKVNQDFDQQPNNPSSRPQRENDAERYNEEGDCEKDERRVSNVSTFRSRLRRRPGSGPVSKPSSPSNSSVVRNVPSHSDDHSLFTGVLELHPKGFGYLRDPMENYVRLLSDPFVPKNIIEDYVLREGVLIQAKIHPNYNGHGPRVMEMVNIEGIPPEDYIKVKPFDRLVSINPNFWFHLETGRVPVSTRVVDILTPLGKGQRALIIAPPRTGKTILIQQICHALVFNYPEVHVIALFMNERPEEVTDFRRAIKSEVVRNDDGDVNNVIRNVQLIFERCKRLVEMGKDVFLLLDSITALARAVNEWFIETKRMGKNADAFDTLKKLFALACLNKEGGSLTIVGTLQIDTGNQIDESIFHEFQGMGNMKLVLDRELADYCVWPAVNVFHSKTRFEELLLSPEALRVADLLRHRFLRMNVAEAMEFLTGELARYESNEEFFCHCSH